MVLFLLITLGKNFCSYLSINLQFADKNECMFILKYMNDPNMIKEKSLNW